MKNIKIFQHLLAAVVWVFLAPAVPFAQTADSGLDYDIWERTALRAEESVDAGRASDIALENLRSQLTTWRDSFLAAQSTNAARIKTLQSQIEALGEPQNDEPEEIANRRSELATALAQARVPGQTADEAYRRADGLIKQIDAIIRERQTDELLSLGPSPLNPAQWGGAINALLNSAKAVRAEFVAAWNSPVQQAETKRYLPLQLALIVLGGVLLLRGRRWSERLSEYLANREKAAWRWLVGFFVSLGQVILPTLGLLALAEAVYATGLVGLRGDFVISAIPVAGFVFFLARWLGARMFPGSGKDYTYFNLTDGQHAKGRFNSAVLGAIVGLNIIIVTLLNYDNYPAEVRVVLIFPLLALTSLMLIQLGQLLIAHHRNEASAEDEPSYRAKLLRWLGRVVITVAVVGVALGAIGYFSAATKLVFPAAMTLALFAFLLMVQRLIAEIYVLLTGRGEAAREALVPVLIGFLLIIAATPLLALIWGARVATLRELWTKFLSGVSIGEATISPTDFLTFVMIFVVGYIVTRLFQGALRTTILPKTKLDTGGKNAIVSGTGYVGIFLAALIAITGAGIDLSALAIVFGALSVGIGFGLQNIVSNFVSGIILLIERPISEGDWIEVSGKSGYVRDISVRSTRIETFDRADVIVPNADLISGVVMNMTKGSLTGRVIVPVGVAYGNDTKKVEEILREVAEAHPMVILNPAPGVVFQGFGDDSLDFEIRAIIRDVNWSLSVRSDMNHEIARRFGEENIEIPFAQRDIWIKNPEALSTPAKTEPKPPASTKPRRRKKDATEEVDLGQPGDGEGEAR